MKRWLITLLAALAALCASVTVFGDDPLLCATFADADDPPHAREYFKAIDSYDVEHCYRAELVCSGRDVFALMDVDTEWDLYSVVVNYDGGGPTPESEDPTNVCRAEVHVGLDTTGWKAQCRVAGKGGFEVRLTPVKSKFCDDLD